MLKEQYINLPPYFSRKTLWLFVLFLVPFFLNAQSNKIDSLKGILKTAKEDTSKVNAMNALGWQLYRAGENDSARKYVIDAKELAERIKFNNGIAGSLGYLGLIDRAQGNYVEALKNQLQVLRIEEATGDRIGSGDAYKNIGNIYQDQGNNEEAKKNFFAALKIYEQGGADKNKMASIYGNLGIVYAKQNNDSGALKNFLQALEIYKWTGNLEGMANSYVNLGIVYKRLQQYEGALKSLNEALKIGQKVGNKFLITAVYENIGTVYIYEKKYDAARKSIDAALQMGKEMGNKAVLKECYSSLSMLADSMGDVKSAYAWYKLYSDVKDSLLNESSNKQMAEMNTKYQTEKKDKEIKLQEAEVKKQKIIKYGAFSLAALILLLALIGINNIGIKNKAAQLTKANEVRQRISRDLHDEIGSGLTTISMICKQAKRESDSTVPELSDAVNIQAQSVNQKLRELVWAANPENDNLQVMFSSMRSYVFKYFDNSGIEYSFNVPDEAPNLNLEADVSRNLIFVLKEALNNSTKHSDATNVDVLFNIYGNKKFTFKIADNGKGIDYDSMPVIHSGLDTMRKRIEDIKGKFEITTGIGKGTIIEITGSFA